MTLADFILEKGPELGIQWHSRRNTVSPENLRPSSKERVWWQCDKGHEWQATVGSRLYLGRGCPYCAGQLIQQGENDLASLEPEKAAQWHPSKNGDLKPWDVTSGSQKRIWWQCSQGHEWQAPVYSVSGGCGCPYCSGRKAIPGETDISTTNPEVLALWHERNKTPPSKLTARSHKKVWWRCEKGHEWEAVIGSVVAEGCRCPYCAGKRAIPGETDLETVRPDIMEQWDRTKNTVNPSDLLPSAHDKVWWKCELGHSYQAVVFSRTRENGSGCPYCTGRKVLAGFNDLATLKPKLAEEWHPTLNKTLQPTDVSLGSNIKVWWQCFDGHVWLAAVYSRTRTKGTGCPVCAGMVKQRKSNTVKPW